MVWSSLHVLASSRRAFISKGKFSGDRPWIRDIGVIAGIDLSVACSGVSKLSVILIELYL